jgi:hypothetical protein
MTAPTFPSPRLRRPDRVTFLACAAFLLAAWNGFRLGESIIFWRTLREYGAQPDPLYIVVSSGLWLIAGLILTGGLWQGRAWAWYAVFGGAAGYSVWIWFDRLVLRKPHANWPFALGVTLACLSLVLILLLTRKTILFFQIRRKSDERQ